VKYCAFHACWHCDRSLVIKSSSINFFCGFYDTYIVDTKSKYQTADSKLSRTQISFGEIILVLSGYCLDSIEIYFRISQSYVRHLYPLLNLSLCEWVQTSVYMLWMWRIVKSREESSRSSLAVFIPVSYLNISLIYEEADQHKV